MYADILSWRATSINISVFPANTKAQWESALKKEAHSCLLFHPTVISYCCVWFVYSKTKNLYHKILILNLRVFSSTKHK